MAKIYGALEVAQLEWFADASKPSPSTYAYRVIYVTDLKQIQVSDGSAWIPFLNTSTNQTIAGDLAFSGTVTFSGAQNFNGAHKLGVTADSSTGAITALVPTTPVIELTGAATSVAGISSPASGSLVMIVNRSGNSVQILNEDASATAAERILTGTGGSLTLTNNASILLTYVGDNRWHVIGGTGGAGGGSKNYFQIADANPNFKQGVVAPWSACTITLSSGIPSGTPTLSATQMALSIDSVSPLVQSESLYNLKLTKSAAAASGQGFISGVLTIDAEDIAKVIKGSFSYKVSSGTVDFTGGASQSLEIWVYNVSLGRWIQPIGYRGMNQSSGVGSVEFTFQSDSSGSQYRIAVITANASSTAYEVIFNSFFMGKQSPSYGTVTTITDWSYYVPTYNSGFNTRSDPQWYYRRVGDKLEVKGGFALGGTGSFPNQPTLGTGNFTFSIPSGLSVDTAKLPNNFSIFVPPSTYITNPGTVPVGIARLYDASVPSSVGYAQVVYVNTTTFSILANTAGNNVVSQTVPWTWATSDEVHVEFSVPIVGWSSTAIQLSSASDSRVVAAKFNTTQLRTINNTAPAVVFENVIFDTHGTYNSTTGVYTVPVSGYYKISGYLRGSAIAVNGNYTGFILRVNGVLSASNTAPGICGTRSSAANSYNPEATGSNIFRLNAGDQISFGGFSDTASTTFNDGFTCISVEKVNGPSVVAATETVGCLYNTTSVQVGIPSGGFYYVVTVNKTKVFDTHNAFNTTTGTYTAPVSGLYQVSAGYAFVANATGERKMYIASSEASFTADNMLGNASAPNMLSGSVLVPIRAGQTVAVGVFQSSGTTLNNDISIFLPMNYFSCVRVGNY
jgi:hypothetical protein